jgi:hypothetical protein
MRSEKLAKISAKKEVVKILWYSEKTVETFLKFLYTDLIDDDDATTNLLRMAYRFDVGRLFNATSGKGPSINYVISKSAILSHLFPK